MGERRTGTVEEFIAFCENKIDEIEKLDCTELNHTENNTLNSDSESKDFIDKKKSGEK